MKRENGFAIIEKNLFRVKLSMKFRRLWPLPLKEKINEKVIILSSVPNRDVAAADGESGECVCEWRQ